MLAELRQSSRDTRQFADSCEDADLGTIWTRVDGNDHFLPTALAVVPHNPGRAFFVSASTCGRTTLAV